MISFVQPAIDGCDLLWYHAFGWTVSQLAAHSSIFGTMESLAHLSAAIGIEARKRFKDTE